MPPWERYQAQTAAGAGDPVIAVDPYKQSAESRAATDQSLQIAAAGRDARADALAAELSELKIAEARRTAAEDTEKAAKSANATRDAASKLRNVIAKIDEVAFDSADNNGWFETGLTGAAMRNVPGTAAKDLASNVKTIDANAAFNALAEMRANSPTGGALGNVTERELDLLTSSVANLDTAQSQQQFFSNLAEAKKVYLEMLGRIDPKAPAEYATRKGIRWNDKGEALLVSVDGEDKRKEVDPLGIRGGGNPPDGGGNGGLSWDTIGLGLAQGTGDLVEGVGDIAGIVVNPINTAVGRLAGYENYTADFGTSLREAMGLPDNPNQITSAINKGGVGALTGSLVGRGAAALANPGAARNALAQFGATPARDMLAGGGAGLGSEIARQNDLGIGGQIAGALIGGLSGYRAGNALAGLTAPRTIAPIAQAAARQNVDLLPADVGGRGTRIMTSTARSSPFSGEAVEAAASRTQEQIGAAAGRVARSQGAGATTDVAGQGVRSAAERYTKETSARGSRMYDRAYEAAKGVKIKPVQTLAAIDDQLARLGENPSPDAASVARTLQSLRSNIADGVSVRGLRDARTSLSSGVYDGKLRSGPESAMYKQILGNIADDIDNGLRSVGKDGAAKMFRQADDFWKGRVEHIDEVLQPILGNGKSGEEIITALESMGRGQRGGSARLSRLLANMSPEEAGNTRAVIIDRLGRATAGTQNAEGDVFSSSTFLTNWNKMTPQAKASIFNDKTLRSNLNDIARLAEGTKASQSLNNTSNSGTVAIGSAMGAGAVASPVKTILAAGAQAVTGKLLASPGFARVLARTSKMPEAAAKRSIGDQLKVLATREPAIAADARALQEQLRQAFATSPSARVAAEEED